MLSTSIPLSTGATGKKKIPVSKTTMAAPDLWRSSTRAAVAKASLSLASEVASNARRR